MADDGEQRTQKRGTIPTMDDRDRITAGEVNPRMDRSGDSDGRGGEVEVIGKFGGQGAEEAADYRMTNNARVFDVDSAAESGINAAADTGVDTGEDTILYGSDVDENPNGSGRVGIKDDRS